MPKLKTINVSLQSKRYASPINQIISEWKEDGLNVSTEVCESILLKNKVDKSATLLQVLSALDLVEKLLKIKGIEDIDKVEEILNSMISIDMSGLTNNLMALEQNENSKKVVQKEIEKRNDKPLETKVNSIKEEKIEQKKEDSSFEIEIPTDFLMND